MASLLQQVAQDQTSGGHGGGGGGHAVKKTALDAIAQIAANTAAKPKPRARTVAERQAEIEKMKRERGGQRDATDEREETPHERARKNPLLALF